MTVDKADLKAPVQDIFQSKRPMTSQPPAKSFPKRARHKRPATREDVEHAFLIFYGEPAAPEERIEGRIGTPISGLIKTCLRSPKFRAGVIDRLMAGKRVVHVKHGSTAPISAIQWLASTLQRPQLGNDLAERSLCWSDFFCRLLVDARFISAARAMGADPYWIEAIERVPNPSVRSSEGSLIGAIEDYDGLSVRGWAANQADLETQLTVEVYGDGFLLGVATCDGFRRSLQERIGGTGRYGFAVSFSEHVRRLFPSGVFTLTLRDAASKAMIGTQVRRDLRFQPSAYDLVAVRELIETMQKQLDALKACLPRMIRQATTPVERFQEIAEDWHYISPSERERLQLASQAFTYKPVFSIVLPTFESDLDLLRGALRSVKDQIYERFQLVVSDGGSSNVASIRRLVQEIFADGDPRVTFATSTSRLGVSANTNAAIAAATGDYVAFLDHDDALTADALYQFAHELQGRRFTLLYSDEDRITCSGGSARYHTPFFKPDFDYDLLLGMNYVCHFLTIRKDAIDEAGPFDEAFDGAQDHDMILRVVERTQTADICHVPKILYHWHTTHGSVSNNSDARRLIEQRIVGLVNAHLHRTSAVASAVRHRDELGTRRRFATRVSWVLPKTVPRVSIIVPTRDRYDLIGPCIQSIVASLPHYPGEVQILVVDNNSREPEAVRFLSEMQSSGTISLIRSNDAFNWSNLNNDAAHIASGEVLVFLNNDTLVQSPAWLKELVSLAVRPDVGAVGARLLYKDGTIQHAGVLIGLSNVAGHDGVGQHVAEGGYFGRNHMAHGVSAVTGACLAVRRDTFLKVGGFDGERFGIAFNDVDFCLRLREIGYSNVYTPHATLYHFESASRGFDRSVDQKAQFLSESANLYQRWGHLMSREPFYNPNFFRHGSPFALLLKA